MPPCGPTGGPTGVGIPPDTGLPPGLRMSPGVGMNPNVGCGGMTPGMGVAAGPVVK